MTRVTINDALRAALGKLDEEIELCDESGKTVGYFLPSEEATAEDYRNIPPITDEEIKRLEAQTEWFTTTEVLDHLRNL